MKCNKCNFENNNESKFCINCGNELVSNNRSMKNEQIMDTNRQKKTCKTMGIVGIILSIIIFSTLGIIVHNFVKETDKIFTSTNNDTIIKILQDENIISKSLNLIDTVTEINGGVIPYRYTYYIYQEDSGNIIAVYYKTNTITKDNFTVKVYNNLIVRENSDYINDDISYRYSDGSVSEINKYFDIRNNYKIYSIIKNDLGYLVKEEN